MGYGVKASQCCPLMNWVVLRVRVRVRASSEWRGDNAMTSSDIRRRILKAVLDTKSVNSER